MKSPSRRQKSSRGNGHQRYLSVIRKHWNTLQQQYGVRQIGLFGSVVRGENRKRSDIDILVEYEKLPDLLEFINLENYLERILKSKVDLVEKEGIRAELRDHILGEVIYL